MHIVLLFILLLSNWAALSAEICADKLAQGFQVLELEELFDDMALTFNSSDPSTAALRFKVSDLLADPEQLKESGVIETIVQKGGYNPLFPEGIPPIVEEGFILKESSQLNNEPTHLLDLCTILFDPKVTVSDQILNASSQPLKDGKKYASVQFVQRKGKNTITVIDFESSNMYIPMAHAYKYKQYLFDYLAKVKLKYTEIKPEWAPVIEKLERFLNYGNKTTGIERTTFIGETLNPLKSKYKKTDFMSGLLVTRTIRDESSLRRVFHHDDFWSATEEEFSRHLQEAQSFPMELAFSKPLKLKYRKNSAEIYKLVDFNSKENRIDSLKTFHKYLRLVYHRYRNDKSLEHFYFHAMGLPHAKYYSTVATEIETVSLPKLANGAFDYSIFANNSPYMQLPAVQDLWLRIQRSSDPVAEGLVTSDPSIYASTQYASTQIYEPDFIFRLDKSEWRDVVVKSYLEH